MELTGAAGAGSPSHQAHMFAMFYAHAHMHYVNREYLSHYFDDLYPLRSEQHYSECACIAWLYHAYSYSVGPKKAISLASLFEEDIGTTFFLLSVSVAY